MDHLRRSSHTPVACGRKGNLYPAAYYHLLPIEEWVGEIHFFREPAQGEHNFPWLGGMQGFYFPSGHQFLAKTLRFRIVDRGQGLEEDLERAVVSFIMPSREALVQCEYRLIEWVESFELPVPIVLSELVNFRINVTGLDKTTYGGRKPRLACILTGIETHYD